MLRHPIALAASALAFGLLTAHCGSDSDSKFDDGSSASADGGNGTNNPGFANGNDDGGNGTGANAEVCDGIDNDGDGAIDNIDVGNDGVCDCLRIATLGKKGTVGKAGVFEGWLNGKSTAGVADLADQILTPELLAKYQVIVAQNVKANDANHAYSPAEITALADWVKAGGGFLTLIGYSDGDEVSNVNKLLASFALKYKTDQILKQSGGSTVAITTWTPNHPVTNGITKVGVDNGYEASDTDGKSLTLATQSNLTVLKAKEVDKGHVLVWGDEWITFDSEWSAHQDYQVERFWLNMIKWLTPATECQVPIPPSIK